MLVRSSEKKLGTWAWLFHVVGLSIAMGAFAVIYFLVISPIDQRHASVFKKMSELQTVLGVEGEVRAENARLTGLLAETDEKIGRLLDRIPTVPREADFLGQITTLASEVGLEIVDYHPGATTDHEEYQEMTVSLSSEGTYAGICRFLHQINHLPRLSKINELKITPRRDGEVYSMELTLVIYFAPTNEMARGTKVDHG